jgi:hypothetical protein
LWTAGNLGGLIVALIVQVLVHHPLGAFLAMAAVSLLGLSLAGRLTRGPFPGSSPLGSRQDAQS